MSIELDGGCMYMKFDTIVICEDTVAFYLDGKMVYGDKIASGAVQGEITIDGIQGRMRLTAGAPDADNSQGC